MQIAHSKTVISRLVLLNLSLLGIDRFFKVLALSMNTEKVVILPFLTFTRYENRGIAFSIPLNGYIASLLIFFILLCLLAVFVRKYQRKENKELWYLSLLLTGAGSNFYDRVVYGFVIDYINVYFFWWVFNIADVLITIGVFAILWKNSLKRRSPNTLS
jgi:signal peptidase II